MSCEVRAGSLIPRQGPLLVMIAINHPPRTVFEPGQLVRHRRYGYRGVVVDRDEFCEADDEWYSKNQTQPDRDQPWYHVLVEDVNPRNIDQLWISLVDFLDLEISCATLHQLLHECGVESRNGKFRQKMIERAEADAKERHARQRKASQPLPK